MVVEVALAVQQEIQARLDEADCLRLQRLERARYEAECALDPLRYKIEKLQGTSVRGGGADHPRDRYPTGHF